MNPTHNFYKNQPEPLQECFLALQRIILNLNPEISETVKYGMPCFCFKTHILCYLWFDKKTNEPYILMVDGYRINHPKLERGKRAKMKIYTVNPLKDLPFDEINEILNLGLALY